MTSVRDLMTSPVQCVDESQTLAIGQDPDSTTAGRLANGKPFYVDVDASVDEALRIMADHQVRRLPVIADHKLVGVISQCDVARNEPKARTGELVGAISQPWSREKGAGGAVERTAPPASGAVTRRSRTRLARTYP